MSPLDGGLDDVSFWDGPLTEAEVRAIMRDGVAGNEDGLRAFYSFGEVDGDMVVDASEFERHGTLDYSDQMNYPVEGRTRPTRVTPLLAHLVGLPNLDLNADGFDDLVIAAASATMDVGTLPGAGSLYTLFGNGCGNPTLALTNTQLPRLGQPFEIQLTNLPTFRAGAVFTGVSNTTWSGIALPFDLSFLGGAGCTLYVSGEIASPFTTHTSTTLSWGFSVPNDPGLAGVQFFNQGLVVDPLTGLLSTNGGSATIGY